jgi:hypothetical protein
MPAARITPGYSNGNKRGPGRNKTIISVLA